MELLEKFENIESNLKILKEIKATYSFDDISENKRYEWEIRYGLLETIQLVIDISCKVSSYYNLGSPKSYKECVELLKKFKYLSTDTASKVIAMIGLRNLLVHEYAQIDSLKLYNFLENLDDFVSFVHEIDKNIKE